MLHTAIQYPLNPFSASKEKVPVIVGKPRQNHGGLQRKNIENTESFFQVLEKGFGMQPGS